MAVLVIARARLREGVDEQVFVELNQRFQREVAPNLPGLQRFELARMPEGEWRWVVRYTDMQSSLNVLMVDKTIISAMIITCLDVDTLTAERCEVVLD